MVHPQIVDSEEAISGALAALSEPFPDAIAELILDIAVGHLSMNTEQGYAARVLLNGSDPPVIYIPCPKMLSTFEPKLARQLSCGVEEMTQSFRFKVTAHEPGYGSVCKLKVADALNGEWHVALFRFSKARDVFEAMLDSVQTVCDIGSGCDDMAMLILLAAKGFSTLTADFVFENLFTQHVQRWFKDDNSGRVMLSKIADIRVYDWVLDDLQCQMLMENYTAASRKCEGHLNANQPNCIGG